MQQEKTLEDSSCEIPNISYIYIASAETAGTVGDPHAARVECPTMVERNFCSSAAPRPEPIRIWFPAALLRHGCIALGNRKAGADFKMFHPTWKYGRPAGVLAVLGQSWPEEFRPPSDVSRHARDRAHVEFRGFRNRSRRKRREEEETHGRPQNANGRGSTPRCASRHDRADGRPIRRF